MLYIVNFVYRTHIMLFTFVSDGDIMWYTKHLYLMEISCDIQNICIWWRYHVIYKYTIVDLFYENGFLKAIVHRRRSLRCDLRWEVHFEQNISIIVRLLSIWWDDFKDVIIMSHWKKQWYYVHIGIVLYHDSIIV